MAETRTGAQLTAAHRVRQLAVRAAALREVVDAWRGFDLERIDETWPNVAAIAVRVVDEQRLRSSTIAASYYRLLRLAEGVPGGEVQPELAPAVNRTRLEGTLAVLGPIATKRGIARRQRDPAAKALVRVTGTVGRMVLEGGRQTIDQALRADPLAEGYRRVTDGAPCPFCRRLADSGVVGVGVDFPAHDHCGCSAEPKWKRYEAPPAGAFDSFLADFTAEVAQRSAAARQIG